MQLPSCLKQFRRFKSWHSPCNICKWVYKPEPNHNLMVHIFAVFSKVYSGGFHLHFIGTGSLRHEHNRKEKKTEIMTTVSRMTKEKQKNVHCVPNY